MIIIYIILIYVLYTIYLYNIIVIIITQAVNIMKENVHYCAWFNELGLLGIAIWATHLGEGLGGIWLLAGTRFFLLHTIHTGSGSHPATYPVGTRCSVAWCEVARVWNWPLTSVFYQCQAWWSSTSTPPHLQDINTLFYWIWGSRNDYRVNSPGVGTLCCLDKTWHFSGTCCPHLLAWRVKPNEEWGREHKERTEHRKSGLI